MADWVFNATSTGRTGTIQQWTAPTHGRYRIVSYGAQGGGSGGLGAKVAGTFELEEGALVDLAVGHQGVGGTTGSQGGGGGSFVVKDDAPLLVAGGGGGYGPSGGVTDAAIGEDGLPSAAGNSLGGVGGYGGAPDPQDSWSGAGGAGFLGDGAPGGTSAVTEGGRSWANGITGGGGSGSHHADGGFGGGGAGSWAAGGGGGYSGGGPGWSSGSSAEKHGGGGGGSFNSGADQSSESGVRSGDGLIEVTLVEEIKNLDATPTWDEPTDTYTLDVEWTEIDGAAEYRLRLLDDTQALLEEVTTTGLTHAFTGLAAETTYHLELTGLDGASELETLTEEVTTPIGLPGGVTNLQHTFTTDSLTFTWDAAEDADEYLLTLSLDGAEVATQTVTDLTATFDTLADGTQYDLAIQASNAQGDGPIAYYQATTGYLAPAAPVNLRQFEERIIAVICRWDHPDPDKVHDTEVQLLYGSEIVGQDALEGAATERTFLVPMASTDYLLRVRAGNPGGWSAWAEATVHSEKFPLIDSRLGVLGATYQEDVLHPDTWDGGTDGQGFGDPQVVEGGVELKFLDPRLIDIGEGITLSAGVTVSAIASRSVKHFYSDGEEIGLNGSVEVNDIESRPVSFFYDDKDDIDLDSTLSIPDITSVKALFVYNDDESIGLSSTFTVDPITSELP